MVQPIRIYKCLQSPEMRNAMARVLLHAVLLIYVLSATSRAQVHEEGDGLHVPTLPHVTGPIPITAKSHPFNGSSDQLIPSDLSRFGYVEEEYFLNGLANVYEYGSDYALRIRNSGVPYTTRILVRRPKDPAKFSGNVVVEPFNPSFNVDLPIMWAYSHEYFIKNGDAYVGMTIKAVDIRALKSYDAQRYRFLSMQNPLPSTATCPNPGWTPFPSFVDSEDGLVWDMISAVGALLKSHDPSNPLRNFDVRYLYATGQSQTGSYINSYVQDIHPHVKLANGRHVYDGFLVSSSGRLIPLNQCAERLPRLDPHNIVHSDVPFIQTFTQTDVAEYASQRRVDSDAAGDLFRRYEIGGASHATTFEYEAFPSKAALLASNVDGELGYRCVEPYPNDFPVEYLYSGAFANLERWVRSGKHPPSAPPITTSTGTHGQMMFATDAFGNVLGGLRTPYLDVPTSTYVQSSWGPDCFTYFGHKIPFDPVRVRGLYPDHAQYVRSVNASVDKLLSGGWITSEDAAHIKDEASRARVP
jgi:Alpha/beta hydrolase domain